MSTTVTKENQEGINMFYSTELKNADKTRLRARRNGETKTWKTRPAEFKIPIKHGMYDYGYITEQEAQYWTID